MELGGIRVIYWGPDARDPSPFNKQPLLLVAGTATSRGGAIVRDNRTLPGVEPSVACAAEDQAARGITGRVT